MKLEDLTLDVEQRIDIKAPPEKVFAAVLERFGKKNTRPEWGIIATADRSQTRRPLVSRPRQWHWTPLGLCAGHQASKLAGIERPNVYVIPGPQPR